MSDPHTRTEQLAYSELMDKMLDEEGRRHKAAKIIAVVSHALGRSSLDGLRALDVGCSAGFIADELATAGAQTTGVDIDEPGLVKARERFGGRVEFALARGEALPFDDDSMDVVVFNHIYEHVVDPVVVLADIRRVLSPRGVLYLGIGHRHQVIEPHYRLPFLSWLPQRAADRYMRLAGKGDHYHEHYYSRPELRQWLRDFEVWDYTLPVLADPTAFAGDDLIPAWVGKAPAPVLSAAAPLAPTYIWVASKTSRMPLGPALRVPPRRVVAGV
ncbi:MAG: class I SAM-dependent methyltransferase [Micrococcales bacterium]|nr:class I SAM-dependent methyltransferase [Micrococcales bacterium]